MLCASVIVLGSIYVIITMCQVHEGPIVYGYWFYRFYYVFAAPLSKLSKKFIPESEEAIDELLSFQVEM